MDKLKDLATRHSGKIKYLFLCGAFIASINSLSRADYNFILYLYMFFVWTFMGKSPEAQMQDKIGSFYILLYSLLIDLFWCLFWGGKWDTVSTIVHELTLFLSWIAILLKIFTIIVVGISEMDVIKSSIVSSLKHKNTRNNFVEYQDEE